MIRTICLVWFLLLLAGTSAGLADAPGEAASSPLAEAYRAIATPVPGELFDLPGGIIRIGRAEIKPAAGVRPRALLAGGRVCGLLLEGDLTLHYLVDDAFSAPVARRNLKPQSAIVPRAEGQGFAFTLALSGVAIWGPDPVLAQAPSSVAPGARLPPWLTEILAKRIGENPSHDTLVSERNGEPGYRWAALHSQGDDYLLDFDPRPSVRTESLARLRRVDKDVNIYGGRLTWEELVTQPVESTWWDTRALDFVSIATEIELTNDRADHATITSRIRVQVLRGGIRLLPFTLVQDFTDGDNRIRRLDLESVTIDGAPAVFVQSEGSLLIELPAALSANQTVVLEVRTQGDILDRPEGNSYWILRTQSWYPKPAAGGAEHSTFRMHIEVPDPFVPFASGEIVSREKTPGGTRLVTKIDVPTEHAVAIAGRYTTFDRELGGARVHVSTYASAKKIEAERLAGIVLGVRACLEAWLKVPFPFQDLQLVEIKDWGWGQAPPGVIFITQEAFMTPARAQMDDPEEAAYYTRGVNERIAHEVAHSWFPHVAKVRRNEENWLSESFAEYASIECLRQSMRDEKQGEYFFQRAVKDWKFGAKEIGDGGSVYLASHLSGEREKDFVAYRALLYSKGPLVIHALREELKKELGDVKGESAFLTWMRAYAQNFTFKTGETRHLVGILNQITGKDWQPWFELYVFGTEMPKVK